MADKQRIGLTVVKALAPNSEVWDSDVMGFGARRRKGASVSYFLMYRTEEGRQRRFTIGTHGSPWTPDLARTEAKRLLGKVVTGADPSAQKRAKREAKTVTELCDAYWEDALAGRLMTRRRLPKKASTLLSDKGRINGHIKPLLGHLKVASVKRSDIETFMTAVSQGKTAKRAKTGKKRGVSHLRGGKGTASRTVGLLGAIFTYAEHHGMRTDNPVRGVMRPADGKRARRLSDKEYRLLGAALRKAAEGDIWPAAIAATHFLALTGWRSGEALGLRWRHVNLATRTASLPDSKTGESTRALSKAACSVLKGVGRGGDDALVFPPTRGDGTMTGYRKQWNRIMGLGKLADDITPHVLRHSFSSLAGDLGFTELTIAALVGHKSGSVTSRYVHAADAVLLVASDTVANETELRMAPARDAVTATEDRDGESAEPQRAGGTGLGQGASTARSV